MIKRAFVTKINKGSISEAIATRLVNLGFEVTTPNESWDIRRGAQFPKDCSVLVNTAGITMSKEPRAWDWNTADKIISVNLTGAISLTSEFINETMYNGGGIKTIIHLGSIWSRKHATDGAVYCASKAGLAHYIACMGYDLKLHHPDEYSIVGIHPGNVVGTPLTKRVQDSMKNDRGMSDKQVDSIYQECITPGEIADVVEKVLGDKWFNGENLYLGNGDKR